ncbi:MAG: TrkH family potassium uptake protein [Parachlamydiales bacterium]|nr:TrkH family potassium uptake protein [Candidatus Acheromyda pituitae]
MLYREIFRFLGRYLTYFTLILLLPLAVAVFYEFFQDPANHPQLHSSFAFGATMAVSLALASTFLYFGKNATGNFHRRESIFMVALIWIITAGISALPFLFSGTLQNPVDAFFEAMSGLTTTGSTIFHPKAFDPETGKELLLSIQSRTDAKTVYSFFGTIQPVIDPATGNVIATGVEAVGKALLFWRSFLQWLGGMGIVVLFITILPALSMGGRFLFEAEMPGPNKDAMTPRIKETASLLWKIYLGLTAAQIILLLLTNPSLPFFDALTLTFSTISTGGFSIHNDGLTSYHSISLEWIVVIFMVLGSINFSLYFHCLRGKIYRIYEPEFFTFLFSLLFSSLLMTWVLWESPKIFFKAGEGIFTLTEALRYGTFQAISSQTSTGFAIANYDLWPSACQVLMLILLFVGGMSGSTAGGIKIARHCILFRVITHKIESIFRPHAVRCLKIGNREISDRTAITVLVFFAILIIFAVIGTFLLVIDGIDPQTAMGLIASMINNAGVSFNGAGPTESCAFLSNFSKVVSIIWMMFGRLEFFVLLVLLVPAFWREK